VSQLKQTTLSESESKKLLTQFGVIFAMEHEVSTVNEVAEVASSIGFPVAIKICSDLISHKTERGLVALNIQNATEAENLASSLLAKIGDDELPVTFLVAKMEFGRRELIVGSVRDHQFGDFVMLGLGGVFAELLSDTVFAPAPLTDSQAHQLISRLKNQSVLDVFRGESAVDRNQLAETLVAVSSAHIAHHEIGSIDINPLIVRPDGSLVAVDALIENIELPVRHNDQFLGDHYFSDEHFRSLFSPKGVVVVGASTHPGKFGFVSLHNILTCGYKGKVFATNLDGANVLGIDCFKSLDEIRVGEVDLAFVCTPASTNPEIVDACARKKINAIYLTSAGYADADDDGLKSQIALAEQARSLNILLVGPNGQGLVSRPDELCAQIVGPYPPAGEISVVSQSGNFVSSFMNYARQTNVGIARAVSAGNAAQIGVPEFFNYFAEDQETKVVLAYIEGAGDGRALSSSIHRLAAKKPLVIVKGGATALGAKAASSHTGALASDDRIFDGVCASAGAVRVSDVERAFDVAATFATQPLPNGNNVVVLTTIGGWGVVTSDVIHDENVLSLIQLPHRLEQKISRLLPHRWSKNNPIDCAGGETRETVAEIMRCVIEDESVDAMIFLGIGIQSNQARMMRDGDRYPNFELDRIVKYHERQDVMYAQVAAQLSAETRKPILVATELAVADPNNPGVKAVRESGRLCYASGQRAARALSNVYRYAKWQGLAR